MDLTRWHELRRQVSALRRFGQSHTKPFGGSIRRVDRLVTRSADASAFEALNSTPVPEPSTGLLLGLGLALFQAVRRARRHHA